jgi:HEAT repeat protein
VEALGNLGDLSAVEPLIPLLIDKGSGIRESAAKALGNLGDARAVGPLIETFQDS